MKHTLSYKPNYPRVMFSRNNFYSFNGEWEFKFLDDRFDIYHPSKKDFDFAGEKTIVVPYAYQTVESNINVDTHYKTIAYQKNFTLNNLSEMEYVLHFESVDYECTVFVNDVYVGSHIGGYTRFSFEIRHLLKEGKNSITVFVKDGLESDKPRGKQTWMGGPFGCWYKATSGIWKTVWMEQVPTQRLNYVYTRFNYDLNQLIFEYDIKNFQTGMELDILVSFNEHEISQVRLKLYKEHGTISLDMTNAFEAFKIQMWSPNNPCIFDITYSLYKDNCPHDVVLSYYAYNHFEARKNLFYSNNNQTKLKMILFQGYYPNDGMTGNEQYYIDVIKKCKEIGLNGIRMHQKIEDELFYYYCDIMGMYVFLELPSPYEHTERTKTSLINLLTEAVNQFKNHPSIIAYAPLNESWGVPTISFNVNEMNFARSLYYITKSLDPNRLVIDNDGWEHTEATDIVSLHNYDQNYQTLKELYDDINGAINDTNMLLEKQSRACFAKGCSYKGQPIMLDEFVGTTISGSEGWGYGEQSKNIEEYFNTLKNLVHAIDSNRLIAGYCVTQFNDTYAETNGLFDKDFKPKLTVDQFKEIIYGKK